MKYVVIFLISTVIGFAVVGALELFRFIVTGDNRSTIEIRLEDCRIGEHALADALERQKAEVARLTALLEKP